MATDTQLNMGKTCYDQAEERLGVNSQACIRVVTERVLQLIT
jgi:hypothetical protein